MAWWPQRHLFTHLAGGIFGPQWYLASLRASALREWASEKDPKMEAVTFYSLSLRNDAPLFCHLVHRRTLVQLGRGLHGIWILGGGSKWGPFWRLATASKFCSKTGVLAISWKNQAIKLKENILPYLEKNAICMEELENKLRLLNICSDYCNLEKSNLLF